MHKTNDFTLKVTHYKDLRSFLNAHIHLMRTQKPHWTFGSWAKKLGLKSTSSITKVIQGSRDPGTELTERLVAYFSFREKDARYFRDLVRLHKLRKDPRLSVALLEKMNENSKDSSVRFLDDATFSMLSNWYSFALRELALREDFIEDPHLIAKKLQYKATPKEIKQTLQTLEKLGLLTRNKKTNRLESADGLVKTTTDQASEAVKRAHEQHLENAKQALRTISVDQREILTICFGFDQKNLPQAKQLIREFKTKFSDMLETQTGDAIYQLQVQFIPLTKVKKNEAK